MSTPPPSLLVEDLAFAYPDGHQALYGVDLRIERGERVALLAMFDDLSAMSATFDKVVAATGTCPATADSPP